ncbi:MAG: trypsin-like peptidase domain-containing protein [Acidobacteriota bacterium]
MRIRRFSLRLACALTLVSASASAIDKVDPQRLPEAESVAVAQPPMRLAESLSLEPLVVLRPAEEGAGDQLAALKAHNTSGARPVQTGFARPLAQPLRMRLTAADTPRFQRHGGGFLAESLTGRRVWGTHVQVSGAWRLRLRLEKVELPEGTRMWVWGLGSRPREFGLELIGPDGDLWTPSVGGEDVFLEVELPQGKTSAALEIRQVAEAFRLAADGSPLEGPIFEPLGECILDATCVGSGSFDAVDLVRRAVAHLEFVSGGNLFICSGGLLNDTVAATAVPYLLTANHCFSTQGETSSLEAFWDYRTTACFGSFPDPGGLPRSNGGTLLATSTNSDFTFLRLNSIPGGRALLGWSTQTLAQGTILHRISHPAPDGFPFPQSYSRSTVDTTAGTCSSLPRPRFLYSAGNLGGTFGGSSGSPVVLQGGYVVGQLLGACGFNPSDGCDTASNSAVDGAFSQTYSSIKSFIDPPVSTNSCVPDADTLCIDDQAGDKRFRVEVGYDSGQQSGAGQAIQLSSLGVNAGGLFWFFSPTNPELLVKVLNACPLNNKYWVFWSAGTNVGLTIQVTDTVTNQSKTYTNPRGTAAQPVQDTAALPCN